MLIILDSVITASGSNFLLEVTYKRQALCLPVPTLGVQERFYKD